jgi:hypothetical protein
MLSWPRFEPYTKRPEAATWMSAVELSPENSSGKEEIVSISCSAPASESNRHAVTEESNSLML